MKTIVIKKQQAQNGFSFADKSELISQKKETQTKENVM